MQIVIRFIPQTNGESWAICLKEQIEMRFEKKKTMNMKVEQIKIIGQNRK